MRELTDILREATRSIARPYFELPIHGGPHVYRERIYCYELYHQMRCRWPDDTPFILNGEVDKRAHALLADCLARAYKPDFLVHQPGDMNGNHAVIEVKIATAPRGDIIKDLETLSDFMLHAGYQRAIYLIYGRDANETVIDRVRECARALSKVAAIEVWLHPQIGVGARQGGIVGRESN